MRFWPKIVMGYWSCNWDDGTDVGYEMDMGCANREVWNYPV